MAAIAKEQPLSQEVINPEAEPEIVTGSREQVLHLLAEAAEIEHTLMCSYLYAVFSLKRSGEPGLDARQGEAVDRWRKSMMSVAIEEMGHLLIVANLTLAIGGRPHFARPNFPVAPGYFPSGVVVRLSGFSADTLDHFIFLERPRGIEADDAADYVLPERSRAQAVVGLMPSAQDYATIGHLYDALRRNLRELVEAIGEPAVFVGSTAGQVDGQLFGIEGISPIASLREAMAGIDTIVEQGEGAPGDREDSHFQRFTAIKAELEALTRQDPAFAPAWPVADNPVLRQPPEDSVDLVFIDHPEAARVLDFACATYGLLLRVLVQSIGRGGPHATADQKSLVGLAIALMHALGAAGSALARLPATGQDHAVHAGMTFTMLRGVEPLGGGTIEQTLLVEQLRALARAATRTPAVGEGIATKLQAACRALSLGPAGAT